MKPQPMIVVNDVEASSRWYQAVLGLHSGHGGNEYEQLLHEGEIVLQLHHWDAHEHLHLGNPALTPYGNGSLLWFETKTFPAILKRIKATQAVVLEGPLINPNANHLEIWLRDLDGYVVVVASPYGDVSLT